MPSKLLMHVAAVVGAELNIDGCSSTFKHNPAKTTSFMTIKMFSSIKFEDTDEEKESHNAEEEGHRSTESMRLFFSMKHIIGQGLEANLKQLELSFTTGDIQIN